MLGLLPNQQKQLENYMSKIGTFRKNATILFVLSGVIVIGTLVLHSYPLFKNVQAYRASIAVDSAAIQEQTKDLNRETKNFEQKLKEYDTALAEWKPLLDQVLPSANPSDDIAKFLEDFAVTSNKKAHPMKIENLSFAEAKPIEDYAALRFNMSVEADEENFLQFLNTVAHSGSLRKEDFYKGKPVIAMSIESINVTFPENLDTDPALARLNSTNPSAQVEVPTLTFTVEMSAYFRPAAPAKPGAR